MPVKYVVKIQIPKIPKYVIICEIKFQIWIDGQLK